MILCTTVIGGVALTDTELKPRSKVNRFLNRSVTEEKKKV